MATQKSPSPIEPPSRYTGQSHGSTKLPPVQGTKVIFASSNPRRILRNDRQPTTGASTEVPSEFKRKASMLLSQETVNQTLNLLASPESKEMTDDQFAEAVDSAALRKVAAVLNLGTGSTQLPPRSRLIVSGNRRPKHQTAHEVIRREELAATDKGQRRLDDEDQEKYGDRIPLRPQAIDYPEPQNHEGLYRGEFGDTYRALDGFGTVSDWQMLPLDFDKHGMIVECELPKAKRQSQSDTVMQIVGHGLTEVARSKPQPTVPCDNPYAKQRLVQFQSALARQQITAAEVAEFATAAGLPVPSTPFSRS